jgi:hypothetical protein
MSSPFCSIDATAAVNVANNCVEVRVPMSFEPSIKRLILGLTCGLLVRRVKCDETKPFCRKCTSTGRKCDGYPVLEIPDKPAEESGLISPSKALMQWPLSAPPVELFGSDKERRSFHFFRITTAYQLSGFCGDGFWDKLILQATHHEPSIRHAVIALGSLHERFIKHNGLTSRSDPLLYLDEFALRQYSLAIRSLFDEAPGREKPAAVDICLVTCVLFACFEVSILCVQERRFFTGRL